MRGAMTVILPWPLPRATMMRLAARLGGASGGLRQHQRQQRLLLLRNFAHSVEGAAGSESSLAKMAASVAGTSSGAGITAIPRVLTVVEGPVATITLCNPAKRNALDLRGYEELPAAVSDIASQQNVRVVVVRGDGEHAFGAGSDISEFAELRMVRLCRSRPMRLGRAGFVG